MKLKAQNETQREAARHTLEEVIRKLEEALRLQMHLNRWSGDLLMRGKETDV